MLIVLVPELDALLAETDRVPGRVARVLQRGTSHLLEPGACHGQLLTGQAVPAAPLTRRLDRPHDADGVWMRADPVGLQPDLNAVWVQPGMRMATESPVVRDLKSLFAESGMQFDLPVPERGYLNLESVPDCRFEPPWSLPGVSLDDLMPSGNDARQWRALLSECQIVMHQHRENDTPGSLWFWGGGQLPDPESLNPRVARVIAADPVLVALAEWLDLPLESNDSLKSWSGDDVLIEWPANFEHSAADNLDRLDSFLKPAWRRLKLGQLDAIELAGRQRVWRAGTSDAWRFWKRGSRLPE